MKQLSDILKEQSQHRFLYKDLLEDNCCYDPSQWSNNMSDNTEDRTLYNKSITILSDNDITDNPWCQDCTKVLSKTINCSFVMWPTLGSVAGLKPLTQRAKRCVRHHCGKLKFQATI